MVGLPCIRRSHGLLRYHLMTRAPTSTYDRLLTRSPYFPWLRSLLLQTHVPLLRSESHVPRCV